MALTLITALFWWEQRHLSGCCWFFWKMSNCLFFIFFLQCLSVFFFFFGFSLSRHRTRFLGLSPTVPVSAEVAVRILRPHVDSWWQNKFPSFAQWWETMGDRGSAAVDCRAWRCCSKSFEKDIKPPGNQKRCTGLWSAFFSPPTKNISWQGVCN